jgi:(p)ppGpp synthase/HD superfamily hydrolase
MNQAILNFATRAHLYQLRKYTDDPYIIHPVAVADMVKDAGGDENMVNAALLHDVLEDTSVTHAELRAFLFQNFVAVDASDILNLVVELTDVFTKEDFPDLNRKARKTLEANRLGNVSDRAKQIKLMDIEHNSESIIEHDPKFAKVFLEEKKLLLDLL